jgi:hypothetical protein
VAVRDIETSAGSPAVYATDGGSDAGTSFSFLFIPWTASNLIAGHINGTNGATIKGTGNYTLTRLSAGHYSLSIPGKTDTNGALMLLNSGYLAHQPPGMSNIVDNSFLSYEYGGTNAPNDVFMIDAVTISTNGGNNSVVFTDADFNFVWVDFQNPLTLPSANAAVPVLSIVRSGASVIVSWVNGPGLSLQSTTSLSGTPTWTSLGTQNPQTLPIGAQNQYFRVAP